MFPGCAAPPPLSAGVPLWGTSRTWAPPAAAPLLPCSCSSDRTPGRRVAPLRRVERVWGAACSVAAPFCGVASSAATPRRCDARVERAARRVRVAPGAVLLAENDILRKGGGNGRGKRGRRWGRGGERVGFDKDCGTRTLRCDSSLKLTPIAANSACTRVSQPSLTVLTMLRCASGGSLGRTGHKTQEQVECQARQVRF